MNAITLIENFQRGNFYGYKVKHCLLESFGLVMHIHTHAYKLKREHYVYVCWKAFMTG